MSGLSVGHLCKFLWAYQIQKAFFISNNVLILDKSFPVCVWQDKNLPEWKLRILPPPKPIVTAFSNAEVGSSDLHATGVSHGARGGQG